MNRHEVAYTKDARRDFEEIGEYIEARDSAASAVQVLEQLAKAIAGLGASPSRGSFPKEMLTLGIRTWRQTHFKPYRIIYQVDEQQVTVMLIADGRRNLTTLMNQRLLNPDFLR